MPRLFALLALLFSSVAFATEPGKAAEQAHSELWRRFVDRHGVMLDFAGLDGSVPFPTPEECRDGKPNALGWWSPIENGAMFNGLYMDAAILRWQQDPSPDNAGKARRLMEGLLFLNSVSEVPGFVARAVSTDGRSHYPMGSNDQTLPWLVGLWKYWQSGLATPEEMARIRKQVTTTVEAIMALGWKMPAEPPFGTRGTFEGYHFDEAARLLFTLKFMHALTSEERWQKLYTTELSKRGGEKNLSKLEICRGGMAFYYAKTHNWTSCTAVSALRALWEMERDPELKGAYAAGLSASASLAAESLPLAQKFDPADRSGFNADWRSAMLPHWKPQATEHEAVAVAMAQLRKYAKTSPRRVSENAYIREATSAAWIITLCPDPAVVSPHIAEIERIIARFEYNQLYYSTFFWVESAWWRLRELKR